MPSFSHTCNKEFVTAPIYIQLPSIFITAVITWLLTNMRDDNSNDDGSYEIELQIQREIDSYRQSVATEDTEYQSKKTKCKNFFIKYNKKFLIILMIYKSIVFIANVVVDILYIMSDPTYYCYSLIVASSGNYKQYVCILVITLYKLILFSQGSYKWEYVGWRTRIWYGIVHILGLLYLPAMTINAIIGIAFICFNWPCRIAYHCLKNVCKDCSRICKFLRFLLLFVGGAWLLILFTEAVPAVICGADSAWMNRNIKSWWNKEGANDYWETVMIWMFAQFT